MYKLRTYSYKLEQTTPFHFFTDTYLTINFPDIYYPLVSNSFHLFALLIILKR